MPRNATSMMINVLIPIAIHNSGSVRTGADIPLTAARSNSSFQRLITQEVVAVGHNKSWVVSGRKRSLADSKGQPNIYCWP